MENNNKILIRITIIVLAVIDLMALHDIHANESNLVFEYFILTISIIIFVFLAAHFLKEKKDD
jgi:hypothetical protein